MSTIDVTPPLICKTMVVPPLPTLGGGLSLDIQIPGFGFNFDLKLCCKVFQIPLVLPPIALGLSVIVDLSTVSDLFNAQIATINQYLDQIPVICPREKQILPIPI